MAASTLLDRVRTLNWPRMRPRFIIEVSGHVDHVMDSLRAGAEENEPSVAGNFSERHGVLTVRGEDRQFWSTHLSLTIVDTQAEAGGVVASTRVSGVFSPQPEIWTAYVFAIGLLIVISVFATMWAVVQLTMGHAPSALLVSLFAALVGGLVYTSTLVGQGLALGEMYQLRRHVDECLADAEARGLQALSEATPSV